MKERRLTSSLLSFGHARAAHGHSTMGTGRAISLDANDWATLPQESRIVNKEVPSDGKRFFSGAEEAGRM
jgi:hypothetical protein